MHDSQPAIPMGQTRRRVRADVGVPLALVTRHYFAPLEGFALPCAAMAKTTPRPQPEPTPKTELPTLSFATPAALSTWLAKNHAKSPGFWLKLAKKGSAVPSVTYAEAVEVALVWGWIDGQKASFDELAWLQKFTRRGARSIWSKINREKATALVAAGEMQPPGLVEVERAKADGRWDDAYDPPSKATVPDDLTRALAASPKAAQLFATLNATNRYSILWRVQTAKKPETRARRIADFVEKLTRGEKPYA
jgi:uncharacterized protein YdeI (YjbR/CyaY-like superfamily)